MKYKGLCEEYGPLTVAAAAMAIPVGLEAGLSQAFNYSASYTSVLGYGAWAYFITHFAGKAAMSCYLKDKGDSMGPGRASRLTQRIQAGIYAAILAGFMGHAALREDGNVPSLPVSGNFADQVRIAQSAPAQLPSQFVLL